MEAWKNLFVPNPVLWALKDEGFMSPTTIQALSIPHAIRDRLDIVGAAETGSGKTLAFCVPILHHVLNVQTVQDALIEQTHSLQDTQKYISQNETDSDSNIDILQPEFNPEEDWGDSDNSDEENNSDEIDDSDDVDNDDVDSGVDNGSDEDGDYDNPPTEEDIEELGENEVGCVRVVHNIVLDPTPQTVNTDKPLIGLILEPTRELAIQVKNHLLKAAKYINVKIATVVGGMAPQKQRRILSQCPEIIIATPGRLWELLQEGDQHLIKIPSVKVLVVDEADRMVEKGHFEELTKLFEFMKDNHEARLKRQTLVFSATLTMIHKGPSRKMKKKKKALIPDDKLDLLMYQIGIKDKKKIVDLTTKTGTAENLTEARINCPKDEKDLYLYYFRRQYPGRTLVFANSKDCLRRLVSIFTELGCKPLSLHADMHQKQRLKNLEKFSASNDGFLLASDVAARGLDIPNVQHVIHYQVPRTIENYVHRSGRTARATKEGLSVMLISQDDVRNYRKIISTLNRDEELPVFPVEYQYIPTLKSQLRLALEIDKLHHRFMKVKRQNDWFSKAAEEMEIDIKDEKLLVDIGDNEEQRQHAKKLVNMRADLLQALKQPLAPRTFSGKYPTKMGKLVTLHDAGKY
ncbi:hypothetical protein SNE40_004332 [Patella caerulea]|uniref:ATP-dependent RNA helicase n=1 Tax=Patella caerulea TaxID=87958 RepID=A0AAN8K935_PATCE